MLRAREQRSAAQKSRLISEVERLAHEHFPPTAGVPGAEVTGFYVLLTNLITSVLRDQWICFGVATLGVGLMMTFCFRSIPLALIALVPNALPIIVLLGAMGWFGIRVNMGAAMIAAVSMGLSVDSSIHYVTSFRRARATGKGVTESLSEVQQAVGRAVVYSTIALVVGFLALCTSNFIPTIYFGGLVSLAMLGGLFGNLIILPLLLNVTIRDAESS
jgi:predicted RND superfamily exporter protein